MKKICPRCSNQDQSLFYQGSKGWYCRACVRFSRMLISETHHENWDDFPSDLAYEVHLDFELTQAQKQISELIIENMKKKDVLVWAVTGAGKTELCMDFISQCLKQRKELRLSLPEDRLSLSWQRDFQKRLTVM